MPVSSSFRVCWQTLAVLTGKYRQDELLHFSLMTRCFQNNQELQFGEKHRCEKRRDNLKNDSAFFLGRVESAA